ncbi:TatD family hydrolase [Neisseria chenwenguii]|uniref:Hydrolase n=1 Tax=Neisseria chenwenguii TaxID=1853278 RepID=A0A220S2Y8_9NEIS|nr:TatD family hydrolase [Neisseria chenwenguii]ASK27859.1 hydrolase [Neisseria chenwenguii]ROV56464.1 TatD family deoxyribonuclease [Neisseria chenwenguii]
MLLTDTHCHLTAPSLRVRLSEILQTAQHQGVRRFVVPSAQRQDWQNVMDLAQRPSEKNAPVFHAAVGIHPWFAESADDADFAGLSRLLREHPQLLVGETGLDFYDKAQTAAQRARQIRCFEAQLALAQVFRRPVIIHCLKAAAAVAASVRQTRFTQGGIVHAFSGSLEEAETFIKQGFLIGIGSLLLLNPAAKKARAAAAELPLDKIVLETDSPFMLRGETNTPANVRKIAEITAQLRGIAPEDVARQTEANVDALLARFSE